MQYYAEYGELSFPKRLKCARVDAAWRNVRFPLVFRGLRCSRRRLDMAAGYNCTKRYNAFLQHNAICAVSLGGSGFARGLAEYPFSGKGG